MASRPSAAGHFSFRHDVTVENVRDCLAKSRGISLFDCGCGDGDLPKALQRAGLDTTCIRYFGMDQDNRRILTARAEYENGAFGKYQSFDASIREIENLAGYQPTSMDVIVLNNILHEIATERIPRTLVGLNSLLARPHGVLCIVDMEELPADEVFEPWAVTFALDEVVTILRAGGWCPQGSAHPKRVPTYKVVVGPAQDISQERLIEELRVVLTTRKKQLLAVLDRHRSAQHSSADVQRLACGLAAVMLSIQRLSKTR